MAFALEGIAVNLLAGLQEIAHAIGELQLASGAKRGRFQRFKNLGRENVATDDSEVGGSVLRLGFLHQVFYPVEASAELAVDSLRVKHAIRGDRRTIDFLGR